MFVAHNDIKQLLVHLTEDPKFQNINELLKCLEIYPIEIWENCQDNHIITRVENNTSPQVVYYRALSAILVPRSVPEWLSWLKSLQSNRYSQDSLAFQEDIWEASKQNKTAHVKLRKLIEAGISELLCDLTNSYTSDKDNQNACWLLVKERRNNIWYDNFKNYSHNMLNDLPSLFGERSNKHEDYFYYQTAGTLSYLQQSDWKKKRPDYLNLAKLFAAGEHYELSAIFYQISVGRVSREVLSQISQMDIDRIFGFIPLRRKPSVWSILWRILRYFSFLKYVLVFVAIVILAFVIGFVAFHTIFNL